MIGGAYKIHKDNIIDLYNGYKQRRGDINDGVNLEFLESRIDSLKKGKYILAVAGEVKAGKSTFINALLGVELLPSDVLQASSAIVEVHKSIEPNLKIKYADENEETISHNISENQFREKLSEVCSINDKYREIPTTLINDLIINNPDEQIYSNKIVEYLEKQSNLNLADKNDLIKEYIDNHPTSKIPLEIQIGFPLKWHFDELRIVDSPGVNAIGGVQEISFEYFENANAIAFIHRIDPIESKSFRDFVNSQITERSKDTLFLILTHAGLKPEDDVLRLHSEAKRLFKNEISEDKILVVDSILKLIHNDIQKGLSIEQIEESSPYKADILPKFQKKAEMRSSGLDEILLEYSQFRILFETIEKFSLEAPNIQLQEILNKIIEGYRNLEDHIADEINLREKKKKNPQVFEEEIERTKNGLNEFKILTHKTKEELAHNYTGRHTKWNGKIDKLKVKYPELINKCKTADETKKHFLDALSEIENIGLEYSKSITIDLNIRLKESGKKFQEEHKITIPKIDLDAIENKANKSAYKKKDVFRTRTESFWENYNWLKLKFSTKSRTIKVKTGEKKEYDENIFLGNFKSEITEKFYSIVNNLSRKLKDVLSDYLDSFEREIKEVIENRKKALDDLKDKKQSNEQLIKEIEGLKSKKKSIQPELKRALEILADLK